MPEPFFETQGAQLFHGDMREVVPVLNIQPDVVIADPPYAETSLPWDRWPAGWPDVLAETGCRSMWCFGSLRLYARRWVDFETAGWKLSHDVVWNKDKGSGFQTDRLRRVHELIGHWYVGRWSDIYHDVPRVPHHGPNQSRRNKGGDRPGTHGGRRPRSYVDDGTRLMRSVVSAPALNNRSVHPCQKPTDLLGPLIRYACPPGGLVLDPFAGSGSTAVAARLTGRRTVLIETDERYCEVIARRLAQGALVEEVG